MSIIQYPNNFIKRVHFKAPTSSAAVQVSVNEDETDFNHLWLVTHLRLDLSSQFLFSPLFTTRGRAEQEPDRTSRNITVMESSSSRRLCLASVVMAMALLSAGQRSTEVVTGILGSNITLTFKFNISRISLTDIALYRDTGAEGNKSKIMEAKNNPGAFTIHTENATVLYHMINLTMKDSQTYYVGILVPPVSESNRVQLLVIQENSTTAGKYRTSPSALLLAPLCPDDRDRSRGLSSPALTGAVLCPLLLLMLLLTAALLTAHWCLRRTKETNGQVQDSSIPTVHDRVVSTSVQGKPGSSLVYSVLDFPQRPARVLDLDNDTQYASISYLPGTRGTRGTSQHHEHERHVTSQQS
ncbi:hypothetical protein WMY93_018349 [Mugilogobius chulae]|uniref:Immunoglobulin V-set domain-containing protein n=1 Tax=Mugilogobius chulae TaxID=88201 RepID=A0AAW0NIM0_9GOBI